MIKILDTPLGHGQQSLHHLDFVQQPLWPMYLLGYPVLFHKKVLFRQWEHSIHLYIRGIPSPHLIIVNVCTIFHGTVYVINADDCGLFKFSVARCNWRRITHCNLPKLSPPTF